jgi:hypothetical protein
LLLFTSILSLFKFINFGSGNHFIAFLVNPTMKFTVLPALQLAAATTLAHADSGLVEFGRSLNLDNSPIERLRHSSSKASKVVFIEELEVATEIAAEIATSVAFTSKTEKQGFHVLAGKASGSGFDSHAVKGAKASKVLRSVDNQSYDFVLPKSSKVVDFSYEYDADSTVLSKSSKALYLSYNFGGDDWADSTVLSKSSKTFEMSYNFGDGEWNDAMSYDYSSSEVLGSMPFDLVGDDLNSPTMLPTASAIDDAPFFDDSVYNQVPEETGDIVDVDELDNFGRLVFE